jgi:hypothetical protein
MKDTPVFKSSLVYQSHEDILYHELTQPSEDIILARNAELRKNPGCIRDLGENQDGGSWGRQVANIPMIILNKAVRDGYDLLSKDATVAEKELYRFLQSDIGKLCLIR